MINVVQAWLIADQHAVLESIALWPRCKPGSAGEVLMEESDEAYVYHLLDDSEQGWVLKKFRTGWEPHPVYAAAIQSLVPEISGFESGFKRKLLSGSSVSTSAYCEEAFCAWIDGAVLMPEVVAPTWAELTDAVSNGSRTLSTVERFFLCEKLSEKIDCLESVGLAHRNLSSSNVMIDPMNIEVHLIDWDDLYSVTLPEELDQPCGTAGYIAPFVRLSAATNSTSSWRLGADRFGLAVLSAELLVTKAGSRRFGSGLLDQKEIYQRFGQTLEDVRHGLQHSYAAAGELLDAALNARSFAECPTPRDWIELMQRGLDNSKQTFWDDAGSAALAAPTIYAPQYEPHFVSINEAAFVKIDSRLFVKAPGSRRR